MFAFHWIFFPNLLLALSLCFRSLLKRHFLRGPSLTRSPRSQSWLGIATAGRFVGSAPPHSPELLIELVWGVACAVGFRDSFHYFWG